MQLYLQLHFKWTNRRRSVGYPLLWYESGAELFLYRVTEGDVQQLTARQLVQMIWYLWMAGIRID
jgi:hypothetical protein